MNDWVFYTAGSTASLSWAIQRLTEVYDFSPYPKPYITHLLLPVPSIEKGDCLKGGGNLKTILARLPEDITVIGGNLPPLPGYRIIDLLKDPYYATQNAYITANCALKRILDKLPIPLRGCKILVIGWGRIGKCLSKMLKSLEAHVTVAARKESDRAMLQALGYDVIDTENIDSSPYRVICNTVPAMVLPEPSPNCLKFELASSPGIGGNDVIDTRGLPGKDAPEASGDLIAKTILRIFSKEAQI